MSRKKNYDCSLVVWMYIFIWVAIWLIFFSFVCFSSVCLLLYLVKWLWYTLNKTNVCVCDFALLLLAIILRCCYSECFFFLYLIHCLYSFDDFMWIPWLCDRMRTKQSRQKQMRLNTHKRTNQRYDEQKGEGKENNI